MTHRLLRQSVRPSLENLEDRCMPAGTVTGSLTNGVWRLTGDDTANKIAVTSSGSPGAFTVTGDATTVVGVTNAKNVHRIVFDMKGDNDSVTVYVAKPASMAFQGGNGNNTFIAQRVALANSLQVVNGIGYDESYLENVTIAGNVNVNNGSGGSFTFIHTLSAAAGFNNISGNVTIANGAGTDYTTIVDTNIAGNVTVNNGPGDGSFSGTFTIYNLFHTDRRSVIGGNVTATYQDGNDPDGNGIFDAVVRGNVLFNYGSGAAEIHFDGYGTNAPVVIHGRLKIVGTGACLVSFGRQYKHTGLKARQNLVIDVVNPTDLTLRAFNLIVQGQTKII